MNAPTHLTNAPKNGKLIAWHTSLDIAAYSVGTQQVFVANGVAYNDDWASQNVIDLCRLSKRDATKAIAKYALSHATNSTAIASCAFGRTK